MTEQTPIALADWSKQPLARSLAAGRDWRLNEYVCRAGPEDRPFEERHETVSIAAVLEGTFRYAADTGRALLHPGALMLGNVGTCYECGHDHSTGDRCAALHLEAELFAEIAATTAGSARFRFPVAMLPASRDLAAPLVALLASREQGQTEEAAIRLAEDVVASLAGHVPRAVVPNARDHRRIDRVLRYIEANAERPLDLDELAGVAIMSKYHFLRCFRRIVGVAPYEFLLGLRLRRAALRLTGGDEAVSAIVYDCGFGDLSSFNARFRSQLGEAPGRFRARYRRSAG